MFFAGDFIVLNFLADSSVWMVTAVTGNMKNFFILQSQKGTSFLVIYWNISESVAYIVPN